MTTVVVSLPKRRRSAMIQASSRSVLSRSAYASLNLCTGEIDFLRRHCYRRRKSCPEWTLSSIVRRHAGKSSPKFTFQRTKLEILRAASIPLGGWNWLINAFKKYYTRSRYIENISINPRRRFIWFRRSWNHRWFCSRFGWLISSL